MSYETDGCVKTVPGLMNVERNCFYRFAINRGWESAVIVEVKFILISLLRIQKQYDYATVFFYAIDF